jgi:hypothetical protein
VLVIDFSSSLAAFLFFEKKKKWFCFFLQKILFLERQISNRTFWPDFPVYSFFLAFFFFVLKEAFFAASEVISLSKNDVPPYKICILPM